MKSLLIVSALSASTSLAIADTVRLPKAPKGTALWTKHSSNNQNGKSEAFV